MLADYPFYTGAYHGALIAENDWPAAEREAEAYLRRLTFGRLGPDGAPDSVRMAVCAVAEAVQRHSAGLAARADGVKSENTDGYGVTWEDGAAGAARYEAERLAAADLYLPRCDPLRYAGVDRC